jgi:ribosomal protein S18 acetylase RimI-like enzyme
MIAEAAGDNFRVHAAWAQERVAGMRVFDVGGVILVDSGLPCDTFNCILRARLTPETAGRAISAALAHFHDAGRPFSWWVGPGDRPADLGARLEEAGLVAAEGELAMSVGLEAQPPDAPPAPADLAIERVSTPAQLADFAAVNAANWSPPDTDVLRFYASAASVLLSRDSPFRYFLGRVAGQPAATLELAAGGVGVGGIYNVATLERFRRRGYASAMMRRALEEARAAGLRHAVLQASPDGIGVYRRQGFSQFGTITEYKPHA